MSFVLERRSVDAPGWLAASAGGRAGGRPPRHALGYRRCRLRAAGRARAPVVPRACAQEPVVPRRLGRVSGRGAHAARGARPAGTGGRRRRARLAAPWRLGQGCISAAARSAPRCAARARRCGLRLRKSGGRRRARNRGRPGTRGHHRARALPLLRRRRARAAPRGAPGLRAQRHREALRDALARSKARALPAGFPATPQSPSPGPTAMALEHAAGTHPSRRALWLRALLLERERIANHLGDLGALGNDGGLAFGLAQFSRLKEDLLRQQRAPLRPPLSHGPDRARRRGRRRRRRGSRCDAAARAIASRPRSAPCAPSTTTIPGLQDRFINCGRLAPRLAARARAWSGSPPGKRHRDRRARVSRLRAVRRAAACAVRAPQRRRRRAGRGALRGDLRVACALRGASSTRCPATGEARTGLAEPAEGAFGAAGSRAGAARSSSRSSSAAGGRIRRCHLPRSVVAELAGARARGDRQHRAGLPAHQQIVQPVLLGARPSDVEDPAPDRAAPASSREPPPAADDGAARRGRAAPATSSSPPRPRARDPPRRRRLVQRLRARDPRAEQPVLQPRRARHPIRRQPAPCRHAAGHRPGLAQHGEALRRTYEATPEPKLVVAIGDCGCSGGIFGESYASRGSVANVIPVDVAVPGCPPQPVEILQGILSAVTSARRSLPASR